LPPVYGSQSWTSNLSVFAHASTLLHPSYHSYALLLISSHVPGTLFRLVTARTPSAIGDRSTLAERNIDFGVTAWRRVVYRCDNLCYMRLENGPTPIP